MVKFPLLHSKHSFVLPSLSFVIQFDVCLRCYVICYSPFNRRVKNMHPLEKYISNLFSSLNVVGHKEMFLVDRVTRDKY